MLVNRAMIVFTLFVAGHAGRVAPKDTELPAVTYMMNASANTLGKISKHVTNLGDHMSQLISQQKAELASQKAEFEKKLKLQAESNTKLEAQNDKTSTEIWQLEKSNDDLRSQAKKLQKENVNLRKAFTIVQAKADAVDDFAKKVLEVTDDAESSELAVLSQKEENKDSDSEQDQDADGSNQDVGKTADSDQDNKDGDAAPAADTDSEQASEDDSNQDAQPAANATATEDSDDQETGSSFLALSSKLKLKRGDDETDDASDNQVEEKSDESSDDTQVEEASQNATSDNAPSDSNDNAPADPKSQDMVEELKDEIAQLSQQQETSRAELTKMFNARFKKGANKKAQILDKQKLLDSTKASLTKLHTELEGAVKHLKVTKKKLEDQLHGLGHYLGKLASFVSEPAADAEKALPSLPSDVQVFLQKKRA